MPKKVLFIIPALGIGGAEKSLIELLRRFNYEKYEIDLLLFQQEGPLVDKVNKNVNLLYLPRNEQLIFMNLSKSFKSLIKLHKYNIIFKKALLSIIVRLFKNKVNNSAIFWKVFNNSFQKNPNSYDIAISYLQGTAAYYTIDKINAKKKILWMHTDFSQFNKKSRLDKNYNKKFDSVVTVSEMARKNFIKHHPEMAMRVFVVYNMIDKNKIIEMAKEPNEMSKNSFNIVSVGRLHYAKGFDLVIPVIRKIKSRGLNVKWYVIGEGPERRKLEYLIKKYNLNNDCYLLGTKKNPYTYINSADLYLQSSRYEGYCITLAEAKVLQKPIITTNFFGAKEQINHMINGLIVNCTVEDIYNGLVKLILDESIRKRFINNISIQNNDNEINKVYKLIEN